ncbi:ComEC/Rec2 family competence protein [Roseococcus microcysteis]|uniref:ComEC/Rec2 family competence protein n=1 Tax=Roseococcus microcysteis TaxID=2771361 RepID=UPI00168BAD13|nr:ComEC/Rec2 family competence protein [Roseococcus microcysteis]
MAALAAGGFYMVLTGSQVPMQRSFAMAALVTVALLAGRRAFSPRVLAFAAVVVLALHPAVVLGPSFQMSFFAVMALVAGWEVARPWLRRDPGPRPWWWWPLAAIAGTALTSVLAGLATTPPGLHHFGRVQLFGVAANALAVPLTSVLVMPAGMLALLLMPLGLEAWPLAIMGWGVRGILAVAHAVASWPGAALSLPPPPAWGLLVTALGMCWLCLWRTRWRLWGLPAVLGGMLAGAVTPPPDALVSGDGRLFALRVEGEVFLERRPGAARFVQEAWLRAWGASSATNLPAQGEVAGGRITCVPDSCTLRDAAGAPRLVLLRPPIPRRNERLPPQYAPRELCGMVPLILSPEPLRGRCPGTLVVDRFSLWRNGAHAAWSAEGRILSDRDWRGDRPWVPPEPRPRGEEALPPAAIE